MGKLRVAAEKFQRKLEKEHLPDNEFYVVLCSNNNNQFNLSRHLTNAFTKLQFHAGVANFNNFPNFVLLLQPSEVPPSKKEYSFNLSKDFLKSPTTHLTKNRLLEVFENRTINISPFVRIGEFQIENRYGPYKDVFDIDPRKHIDIDHSEIIKSIRRITKIGSHRFSDFQQMVLAVICSKFCLKCLEGLLKSIKTALEVEEMIGILLDGVEVPVSVEDAKEGWEWLDDEGKPFGMQLFREKLMDNSWKDRLIIESDSSESEDETINTSSNHKIPPTKSSYQKSYHQKSTEKINRTPKTPEFQFYPDDDEPLTDSRRKAYQSVLEKLEINLSTLESSRRSKASQSKFQTMFQTIFNTNEEMNVYAELIDKMPGIIENGIDKEMMMTVITWLECKLRKKAGIVKKAEERPRAKNVGPKPKARSTTRKVEKRKSYPQSDSDHDHWEKSISSPIRRKKSIKKLPQKIEKSVKSNEPIFKGVDSEFDSSSDFEAFSSRFIQRNQKEKRRDSEATTSEIPDVDDVIYEDPIPISPPGTPELLMERPKFRKTVHFAPDPLDSLNIPKIPNSPSNSGEYDQNIRSEDIPRESFSRIGEEPSTVSHSSNNAPKPLIAPISMHPPANSAPKLVIRPSIFSQSSSSTPKPVIAPNIIIPINNPPKLVITPRMMIPKINNAPKPVITPKYTLPPINNAPKPVIRPSIFPQPHSSAPQPVIRPSTFSQPHGTALQPVIRPSTFAQPSALPPLPDIPAIRIPGTKSLLTSRNPLRAQSVLPPSVRHLKQAMSDRHLIRSPTPTPSSWSAPRYNFPGPSDGMPFQLKEVKKEPGTFLHGGLRPSTSTKDIEVITLD